MPKQVSAIRNYPTNFSGPSSQHSVGASAVDVLSSIWPPFGYGAGSQRCLHVCKHVAAGTCASLEGMAPRMRLCGTAAGLMVPSYVQMSLS